MADRTSAPVTKDNAEPTKAGDAGAAKGGEGKADALAAAAMAAVRRMLGNGAAAAPGKGDAAAKPAHPILEQAGEKTGLALGIIVTEALRAFPGWSAAVVDDKGQPVESVPGAERVGDHNIEKRHEEVVGPKIAAAADKIPPGMVHDFVAGVGAGASEAPGESYRIDAQLSDLLHGTLDK